MQITGKTLKPLTEAKYLNADNVSRYRAIMRIFLMHYDKLKYKLYQEEVYEAMCDTGLFPDYRMEQCRQDLDMLTEWKNLEAYQDTRRVTSIEEFIDLYTDILDGFSFLCCFLAAFFQGIQDFFFFF